MSFALVSPSGPSGSDWISKSSNLEMTDCPRREPGGRRREEMGEVREVVREVEGDVEGLGWGVELVADEDCGG